MLMQLVWFAVGLVLLALGADSVVKGLTGAARRLGVGAFAVGTFVVCFGGSMPDIAINTNAVFVDHPDVALGNIIGSCIVNIGLVLGLCAWLRPVEVRWPATRLLAPLLVAAGLALLAMCWNGRIGYLDGGVLVSAFIALAVLLVRHAPSRAHDAAQGQFAAAAETRSAPLLTVLRLVVGLALLLYGADLVVFQATQLAQGWGVGELFTGLTLVAIGTSLPQLGVSLAAARAGHGDAVIAGVLGSSLLNLTLILGATALIRPLAIGQSLVWVEIPALIAFAAALYPMLRGDLTVRRNEGLMLLAAFFALLAYQVFIALR